MKAQNMTSSKGNKVANQFIIFEATIDVEGKEITGDMFQSYDSNIALIGKEKRTPFKCAVYLDSEYWDYSVTTGKYRNQFLGETKAETQKKIDSGEYKLVNLN